MVGALIVSEPKTTGYGVDSGGNVSAVGIVRVLFFVGMVCLLTLQTLAAEETGFSILKYGKRTNTSDLGVGLWAWPIPIDWDKDGDLDLLVSCPDKPHNGTWFFENPDGMTRFPVFKPGVKVGPGLKNLQVSHTGQGLRIMVSSTEYHRNPGGQLSVLRTVFPTSTIHKAKGNVRFNVWSFTDYNGDGMQDLMIGADDWGYYGWDDGYDSDGNWKRGPLHGLVYIMLNETDNLNPRYSEPFRIQAGGGDVNVYGNPMPNLADFDNDGDLDLICAEFLDGFTWFENVGDRRNPEFRRGRVLQYEGEKLHMHVQMITPSAIDWDGNGTMDLICGDEDGRVALLVNTGETRDGMPQFLPPQYFRQESDDLKFGALVTPVGFDWDMDGDDDLIAGNTSGNIAFIENLDGGNPPQWAEPELIEADGRVIHIQAGTNGSIQGPAEAKWGYTTLSVADWDKDSLPDLVVNSIWGKVIWFRNVGTRQEPRFEGSRPVRVDWRGEPVPKPAWTWWAPGGDELVTQWRTTPAVIDWDGDGLQDLVMLDHQGFLTFFQRFRRDDGLWLRPGKRIFTGGIFDAKQNQKGSPNNILQLNNRTNGGSGRRKICFTDWDQDGKVDLLVNSVSVHWMRNMGEKNGRIHLQDMGALSPQILAGHTTSPTVVDWNKDSIPDLVVGAEDGRFYYLKNPLSNTGSGHTEK